MMSNHVSSVTKSNIFVILLYEIIIYHVQVLLYALLYNLHPSPKLVLSQAMLLYNKYFFDYKISIKDLNTDIYNPFIYISIYWRNDCFLSQNTIKIIFTYQLLRSRSSRLIVCWQAIFMS